MNKKTAENSQASTINLESIQSKDNSWQGQLNLSDVNLGKGLIAWALKKRAIQNITNFVTLLILRSLASKTSGKILANFYLVRL